MKTNIKQQIVYKVVRKARSGLTCKDIPGLYTSAFSTKCRLYYGINTLTSTKDIPKFGPIFAFLKLDYAINFMRQYDCPSEEFSVLKCTTDFATDTWRVSSDILRIDSADAYDLWIGSKSFIRTVYELNAPIGTIFCHSLTPIEVMPVTY